MKTQTEKNAYARGYYARNREEQCARSRSRARRRYHQSMEKARQIKLHFGCMDCGYNEHAEALQFDHRPDTEKIAEISKLAANGLGWERIKKEIEKCDVVCANCHAVRTKSRRSSIG